MKQTDYANCTGNTNGHNCMRRFQCLRYIAHTERQGGDKPNYLDANGCINHNVPYAWLKPKVKQ